MCVLVLCLNVQVHDLAEKSYCFMNVVQSTSFGQTNESTKPRKAFSTLIEIFQYKK